MTLLLRVARLVALLAWYLLLYLLDRRRPSPQVGRFLAAAARALGARVRIEGAPLARDVLFVANHQSWMDILVLGGATGAAFVSKAEVGSWPVVGALARIGGTVFIRRERRSDARAQAETVARALATHRPVAFFPEGGTNPDDGLLPFRASLFGSVCPDGPPGVHVQPVAIDYGAARAVIRWPDDEGAKANARRVIGHSGALPVTLRFLKPLDPAAFADRKALAAAAQAAIAAALASSPADERVGAAA